MNTQLAFFSAGEGANTIAFGKKKEVIQNKFIDNVD
jgi:hypothetical protein